MADPATNGGDGELEELVFQCLEALDPAAELERRTAGRPQLRAAALRLMQRVEDLERMEPIGGHRPADPDPDDRGTWPTLPDVQLESMIGRGGQGFVFRGRQTYLGRAVAVKVLAAEWRTPPFLERFRREARMLAGLQHPHIVTCHHAGLSESGECFLVMEYIEGPTLRAWVNQNGPMPLEAALELLRDLARALEHAHGLGLVHRDVKPENVLLQPRSAPANGEFPFVGKLADLGLARPLQRNSEFSMLTPVGAILGTPVTMAPEQFDAPERVDHRADIYGLGCVLHWALAASPPFEGNAVTKLLEQKMQMRGRGAKVSIPGTPAPVLELIARLLAYDPADRPQSYAALIADLEALLPGTPARAAKHWLAPAIAGTFVLAVAAWAWAPWRNDRTGPELVVAARPTVVEGATATMLVPEAASLPPLRCKQTAGPSVLVVEKTAGDFEFTAPRGAAGAELTFTISAKDSEALRRDVRMRVEPDPAAAPLAAKERRDLFEATGDNVLSRWSCAAPARWIADDTHRGAVVNSRRERVEATLILPRGSFELRGRIEPRFVYESEANPKRPIAETGFRLLIADADAVALRIEPVAAANRFRATLCHEKRNADGPWGSVGHVASSEGAWSMNDPLQFTLRWHEQHLTCTFGAVNDPQPRSVEVHPEKEWNVPWSPGALVVFADLVVAGFTDWVLEGPQ